MDRYAPNVTPKPVTGEVIEASSLTVEQRLASLEMQVHALGLAQLRHMQEQHGIGPKHHPQEPTRELLRQ
jgi:hypothetical protein